MQRSNSFFIAYDQATQYLFSIEYSMKSTNISVVIAESSFRRVLEILDEIYLLFTVRTGQIGKKEGWMPIVRIYVHVINAWRERENVYLGIIQISY